MFWKIKRKKFKIIIQNKQILQYCICIVQCLFTSFNFVFREQKIPQMRIYGPVQYLWWILAVSCCRNSSIITFDRGQNAPPNQGSMFLNYLFADFVQINCSEKFREIYRKKLVKESFFSKVTILIKTHFVTDVYLGFFWNVFKGISSWLFSLFTDMIPCFWCRIVYWFQLFQFSVLTFFPQ